jgi:hypothetical protein
MRSIAAEQTDAMSQTCLLAAIPSALLKISTPFIQTKYRRWLCAAWAGATNQPDIARQSKPEYRGQFAMLGF